MPKRVHVTLPDPVADELLQLWARREDQAISDCREQLRWRLLLEQAEEKQGKSTRRTRLQQERSSNKELDPMSQALKNGPNQMVQTVFHMK